MRLYGDSYGVEALTLGADAAFEQAPFDWALSVRGYAQTHADFYRETYDAEQRYMSIDKELSSFMDVFCGPTLGYGRARVGPFDALRVEARVSGFYFVMNFTVDDAQAGAGAGYVHVGSRNCGPDDGLALEDRDACEFINTPAVTLDGIDVATELVGIDLPRLLSGVDFVAPIYDTTTFDVIGEGPGVECHSSPTQPDCASVFANFGLDVVSGGASSSNNEVFSIAAR